MERMSFETARKLIPRLNNDAKIMAILQILPYWEICELGIAFLKEETSIFKVLKIMESFLLIMQIL